MEDGPKQRGRHFLQFAEAVPEFNSGKPLKVPIHPGDIRLAEKRHGFFKWVGKKGQTARFLNLIEQILRIGGKGSQFPVGAEHQHVVFLRRALLIVDFFGAHQHHCPAILAEVTIHALNEHIVIGGDDDIQSAAHGRGQHILMRTGSV